MMKKSKGRMAMESSRHQCLLKDYKDLQKESEVVKEKLKIAKQKKLILSAEVRFLRRQYEYLMTNQSRNPQSNQYLLQPKNPNLTKQKKYNARNVSNKGRIIGKETSAQNPVPRFDENQKAMNYNVKVAAVQNSVSTIDLNQNVRGKEATMPNMTPAFDLNQISTEEEEELQVADEPSKIEEAKKMLIRAVNDEQHNDTKLPVCRNFGDGSNHREKRKISWQDQVAF